jgi:hypothetical protein
MKSNKDNNQQNANRLKQDLENTSRTINPSSKSGSSASNLNSNSGSSQSKSSSQGSSQGRGWHGDSEGHAKAGRQSHKNNSGSSSS